MTDVYHIKGISVNDKCYFFANERNIKAALANIFMLAMDQMTTYNLEGVPHSEEPA